MVRCHLCYNSANYYGICESCYQQIRAFQFNTLIGKSCDPPFEDQIVGTIYATFKVGDDEKEVKLPAYIFMHQESTDDYSPDGPNPKEWLEELEYDDDDEPDNSLSLEYIIANIYKSVTGGNFHYELRTFKYSFMVRGRRKLRSSQTVAQKKRLFDLYESKE